MSAAEPPERRIAGEMARRIDGFDWSATPAGPMAGWPAAMRAAVDICLQSRFPIWLGRGEQLVMVYNDAYVPFLGDKHPAALGRPAEHVWAEIWAAVGPLATDVLLGRSSYQEDLRLVMNRHGFAEETYFTFSYSPVPVADRRPAGLFCTCTETTGRVLGERRLATLRQLGEVSPIGTQSPAQACAAALEVLSRNRADIPFAAVQLLDDDGAHARTVATYGIAGEPPGAIGDTGDTAVVLPLTVEGRDRQVGVISLATSPYRPVASGYQRPFAFMPGRALR